MKLANVPRVEKYAEGGTTFTVFAFHSFIVRRVRVGPVDGRSGGEEAAARQWRTEGVPSW